MSLTNEQKLNNLAQALLSDANAEVRELLSLLDQAHEHVCSMMCRSHWGKDDVKSDADHSALCLRISDALKEDGK